MILNLEDDGVGFADGWSPLQTDSVMNVANAKFYAFVAEAERIADMVRLGILARDVGADMLQQNADYNALPIEYGVDRVQAVIADAFLKAVA